MIHHRLNLVAVLFIASLAQAQKAPDYSEGRLLSLFPGGGQQGQTVTVEFLGTGGGLEGASQVIVDGPPGIEVRDVQNLKNGRAQATLVIAADALPGRRMLRVASRKVGLTSMGYFVVGRMPEFIEQEPNNELAKAQPIELPAVVNGRVDPELDADCFAFRLRAGEKLVVAALAHAFDYHGSGRTTRGFVDASLELLDSQGRVLQEVQDTLGFDPLLHWTAPAAGTYLVRVQLNNWQGFPEAVYRLVLGEVPFATSAFPPGGQRGTSVEVAFSGPNVAEGTKQTVAISSESPLPMTHISLDDPTAGDIDLPFVYGDYPERVEAEPNNTREQTAALQVPQTVNGRFDEAGDEDWYRLSLAAGEPVWLETTAQRWLRSPVDTRLEVFDAKGNSVAVNDDMVHQPGESPHDFEAFDSKLLYTPKQAGEYFVRISEQTGASGPRTVYRFSVYRHQPDFQLYQWPDAVPVWGPGSNASFVVKVERTPGMTEDIELSVEGLPAGWSGSTSLSLGNTSMRPVLQHGLRVFLAITAPRDAPIGALAPFRVVGRAKVGDATIQRVALPLTMYMTGDRGQYRPTPQARAAVAEWTGPWLEAEAKELTVARSGTVQLPLKVHQAGEAKSLPVVVNLTTNGVRCNLGSPQTLPINDGRINVVVRPEESFPIGTHGICVALGWGSDIRVGMPGPCTQLVKLHVVEAAK
jgi:hypothetical protein